MIYFSLWIIKIFKLKEIQNVSWYFKTDVKLKIHCSFNIQNGISIYNKTKQIIVSHQFWYYIEWYMWNFPDILVSEVYESVYLLDYVIYIFLINSEKLLGKHYFGNDCRSIRPLRVKITSTEQYFTFSIRLLSQRIFANGFV